MPKMSAQQFIRFNLPKNARFRKNLLNLTTDQAISQALEETKNAEGAEVKERALAFLLRALAADYAFQSFTASDVTYSQSKLLQLADYWDNKAPDDGEDDGVESEGFSNVPATFGRSCATDENSDDVC